jgi:hypothetical protein
MPDVQFKSNGLDIRVGGRKLPAYDSFAMTASMDGFRKTRFITANEPQTREILPQLAPLNVDIGYDSERIFTGYLETPEIQNGETRKALDVSANSNPNLLNSPAPSGSYPIEFTGANLQVIGNRISSLFNLEAFYYAEPGAKFTRASLKKGANSLEFLTRLAKQRTQIITDDQFGSVIFSDGKSAGAPIMSIDATKRTDVKVTAQFNASKFYSSVTGVLKGKRGRNKKEFKINNNYYIGIEKPYEFPIDESDEGEIEEVTKSVYARMFADVFSVNIVMPGWRDKNGDLIEPGKPVKVLAPDYYINEMLEVDIRTVTYNATPNTQSATLSCVLPGVFSGNIPEVLPW